MSTKAEIRSQLLMARKNRTDQAATASQIAEYALSLIDASETDIGVYSSTALEPPTENLIEILSEEKNLYFPKVVEKDLIWFKNPKTFEKGAFNILEPIGEGKLISDYPQITTLFIPAFAVSPSGFRLGKGGGFYDRLIAKFDPSVKKIAIVFDSEIIEQLPHESHDQKVDFIVTEKRILRVNPLAD